MIAAQEPVAAVATTGAVAAAPTLASAASLVSDRGCTAGGCAGADSGANLDDLAHRLAACLTELPPLAAADAAAAEEFDEAAALTDDDGPMVMVPDFRGMSLGRALSLARAQGLAIDLEGSGRCREQDPPPGPRLTPWRVAPKTSPPRR